MKLGEKNLWKMLFWGLLAAYCWHYAPYGINETDGGFLNGLAWQVMSGKTLYADIIYVRPPMPVWLRALEMNVIPDQWAVLGERWLFYGKVGLYSWLGAAVLVAGAQRWMLAAFSFVVSAHCYPPAAWHTVDGVLLGALSIWLFCNWRSATTAVFSGLCLAGCMLCKQSFYPMPLIWGLLLFVYSPRRHGGMENIEYQTVNMEYGGSARHLASRKTMAILVFVLTSGLFVCHLAWTNTFFDFWRLTGGAASGGQALQHGVFDYFRLNPLVALPGAILLTPVAWWLARARIAGLAFATWCALLIFLAASFGWTIYQRQEFTVPFAQTRFFFWIAAGWGAYRFWKKSWEWRQTIPFFALLGLGWCASVSWGYNLPILFALPWVYVIIDISAMLYSAAFRQTRPSWLPALALTGLLSLFRIGYEFVYRDGPRYAMRVHLGEIFPKLNGIYSNTETATLYRELRYLAGRYGPNFKTLPAFPQSNYLTDTYPPLPLDWAVQREMQTGAGQVKNVLQRQNPVLFIEKNYGSRLNTDPELQLTMECLIKGKIVEETAHFWVVRFS